MFDYLTRDDYDLMTASDELRERFGDACPGCGTLRWQGDCPICTPLDEGDFVALPPTASEPTELPF